MNILLKKIDGIEYLFKNLPENPVMFPVFWFEVKQAVELHNNCACTLQSVSSLPEYMAGPLHMLISLPDIMLWCGLSTILSSAAFLFILVLRIFIVVLKGTVSKKNSEF